MSATGLITSIDNDWQQQLREAFATGEQLLDYLGLQAHEVGFSAGACASFPLKVPRSFARRMRHGDARDPLLLQVLAQHLELAEVPGYSADPVGESQGVIPHPGLIHKYHGRVLLIVAGGCAINCRYCFRRHFPYEDNRNSRSEWQDALDYVRQDTSIKEVILSGGDPLVATDSHLAELVAHIASIGHVSRLRIHSRMPVVLPGRVSAGLLQAICHDKLETVMVIHANHANEIDKTVADALSSMQAKNITLLNQSVLLRGVNDTVAALAALSETLFAAKVLPYYLHALDPVAGAAHFAVPVAQAQKLHLALAARLSGYLVPKLVREIAGAEGKTPL